MDWGASPTTHEMRRQYRAQSPGIRFKICEARFAAGVTYEGAHPGVWLDREEEIAVVCWLAPKKDRDVERPLRRRLEQLGAYRGERYHAIRSILEELDHKEESTVEHQRYHMSERELMALQGQFTYHAPHGDQVERYKAIRNAGLALAVEITTSCPPGPDRRRAVDTVRDAVMRANAAIACGEVPEAAEPYIPTRDEAGKPLADPAAVPGARANTERLVMDPEGVTVRELLRAALLAVDEFRVAPEDAHQLREALRALRVRVAPVR